MLDDRPAARELLTNLKRDRVRLAAELDRASGEWGYEDLIYRFWHQSFKVYYLQGETVAMVDALRALSPGGRPFHPWFEEIIKAGTGLQFEREHNSAGSRSPGRYSRPSGTAASSSRWPSSTARNSTNRRRFSPPAGRPSSTSTNSDDVPAPVRCDHSVLMSARNKSGIARRKDLAAVEDMADADTDRPGRHGRRRRGCQGRM